MPRYEFEAADGERIEEIYSADACPKVLYNRRGKEFRKVVPLFNTPSAPSRERKAENEALCRRQNDLPNAFFGGRTNKELFKTGELEPGPKS